LGFWGRRIERRQTDRQTDRETDRETDRQTDRQRDYRPIAVVVESSVISAEMLT